MYEPRQAAAGSRGTFWDNRNRFASDGLSARGRQGFSSVASVCGGISLKYYDKARFRCLLVGAGYSYRSRSLALFALCQVDRNSTDLLEPVQLVNEGGIVPRLLGEFQHAGKELGADGILKLREAHDELVHHGQVDIRQIIQRLMALQYRDDGTVFPIGQPHGAPLLDGAQSGISAL